MATCGHGPSWSCSTEEVEEVHPAPNSLPFDFYHHLLTRCPSLGFRTDFCRSPGHRGSTGKGAMSLKGEAQPGSAPPPASRLGSFPPTPLCFKGWCCLRTLRKLALSAPSQAQFLSPRPLPPPPKPAQPAWVPSTPQKCLQCPSLGEQPTESEEATRAGSRVGGRAGRPLQRGLGKLGLPLPKAASMLLYDLSLQCPFPHCPCCPELESNLLPTSTLNGSVLPPGSADTLSE